jgi:SAM-dependent methyltransferase
VPARGTTKMQTPERNKTIYERRSIVSQYIAARELTSTEERLLARYRADIAGGRVLDLGVGAGRTTPYLNDLAASYVGVDFSSAMVAACRQRYPQLEFRPGDARDLSAFPEDHFDFVLFSFNGIDYVGHDDRARVLKQVARVLKPGGLFIFSSHNLEAVPRATFLREIFLVGLSWNPVSSAKAIVRMGLRLFNYAKGAPAQQRTADYAILTDPAHGFVLRTYYITAEAQRRKLVAAGFSSLIDVEPGTDEAAPYYLYYAARKTAGG